MTNHSVLHVFLLQVKWFDALALIIDVHIIDNIYTIYVFYTSAILRNISLLLYLLLASSI